MWDLAQAGLALSRTGQVGLGLSRSRPTDPLNFFLFFRRMMDTQSQNCYSSSHPHVVTITNHIRCGWCGSIRTQAGPAIQQQERESFGSAAGGQTPPPSQPRALGADPHDFRLMAPLLWPVGAESAPSPVTTFLPLRPPGQPVAFSPVARRALGNGGPSFDGQPPEPRHRHQAHRESWVPSRRNAETNIVSTATCAPWNKSKTSARTLDATFIQLVRRDKCPCPGCDCWW